MDLKRLYFGILVVLLLSGCSFFDLEKDNFAELYGFYFTQDDRVPDSYNPGESIVIYCSTDIKDSFFPVYVNLSNGRGSKVKVAMRQVRLMSDKELAIAIQDTYGQAFVSIKEKNEQSAYSPDDRTITTPATISFMIDWFNSIDGVSVTRSIYVFAVLEVTMDPATPELVSRFRNHPNVDLFVPNARTRSLASVKSTLSDEVSQDSQTRIARYGVFSSDDQQKHGFHTESGDTLKATYVQPDGNRVTVVSVVE